MNTILRRHALPAIALVGIAFVAPRAAHAEPKPAPHASNGAKAANKTDLSDAQLLGIADLANTGEVGQATYAMSKTQNEAVKQFAQLMIKEHGAARDKGRSIATELGIAAAPSALSNGVQKDGDDVMSQLEKSSPPNFDRTYMQAQIRLHQKVLRMLDDLIPQADAAQIKALLTDMRGHVEHHLSTARSTLTALPK
ncbi:MAG TPA: DUF4142 domain-containing protein [Polyangiaceae bacterium]|jgi:putative membrane protein|nr:DUF4142 domain-containing protein [Polyangiaceae bacterium]